MKNYKRIDDATVFDLLNRLGTNDPIDESLTKECMEANLMLMLDIRQFLRKVYQNIPKKVRVYKQPTNNSKDIIIGEIDANCNTD